MTIAEMKKLADLGNGYREAYARMREASRPMEAQERARAEALGDMERARSAIEEMLRSEADDPAERAALERIVGEW